MGDQLHAHRVRPAVVVAALAMIASSCAGPETQKEAVTHSKAPAAVNRDNARSVAEQLPPSQEARADDWQKMKDCAAQADRIHQRAQQDASPSSALGRQNHYSAKYNRCFVSTSYVNQEAKKNHNLPLMYDELWDAFEEGLLAICTDAAVSSAATFCTVQDQEHFGDCRFCRAFINDRMNN